MLSISKKVSTLQRNVTLTSHVDRRSSDIGSFGHLTKSGNVREAPYSPRVRVRASAVQRNADPIDMYNDWLIDQLMTSAAVSLSGFKFTIYCQLRKSW